MENKDVLSSITYLIFGVAITGSIFIAFITKSKTDDVIVGVLVILLIALLVMWFFILNDKPEPKKTASNKIICSNCYSKVKESMTFCEKCGEEIKK